MAIIELINFRNFQRHWRLFPTSLLPVHLVILYCWITSWASFRDNFQWCNHFIHHFWRDRSVHRQSLHRRNYSHQSVLRHVYLQHCCLFNLRPDSHGSCHGHLFLLGDWFGTSDLRSKQLLFPGQLLCPGRGDWSGHRQCSARRNDFLLALRGKWSICDQSNQWSNNVNGNAGLGNRKRDGYRPVLEWWVGYHAGYHYCYLQ